MVQHHFSKNSVHMTFEKKWSRLRLTEGHIVSNFLTYKPFTSSKKSFRNKHLQKFLKNVYLKHLFECQSSLNVYLCIIFVDVCFLEVGLMGRWLRVVSRDGSCMSGRVRAYLVKMFRAPMHIFATTDTFFASYC